MPNSKRYADAKCPFFVGSEWQYLRCESGINGTRLRYSFRNSAMCEKYMAKFCCTHEWGECWYARILMEKYDTTEE